VIVKISPETTLTAAKTCLPKIVPVEAALNIPHSVIATEAPAVKAFNNCKVSLVTVVVTRDTVAAALANPEAAVSACNAVSAILAAVTPVPKAK